MHFVSWMSASLSVHACQEMDLAHAYGQVMTGCKRNSPASERGANLEYTDLDNVVVLRCLLWLRTLV